MAAYHARLMSSDPAVYQPASVAWSVWEGSTSKLYPDEAFAATYGGDKFSVAFARCVQPGPLSKAGYRSTELSRADASLMAPSALPSHGTPIAASRTTTSSSA